MSYDYLIIGAGASGLTSALILAQEGYRVALIERSPYLAPLLRGFSRRGVYFDTGFHYSGGLGRGEILDRRITSYNVCYTKLLRIKPIEIKRGCPQKTGQPQIAEKSIKDFSSAQASRIVKPGIKINTAPTESAQQRRQLRALLNQRNPVTFLSQNQGRSQSRSAGADRNNFV